MELTFTSNAGGDRGLYIDVPQAQARGVVLILHGMAEHCARYQGLAQALAQAGYVAARYDHAGHGPQTPKAQLGSFGRQHGWENVLGDIQTVHGVLAQRYPQAPFYLLAHSMGSFMAREYVIRHQGAGLSGLILSGTGSQPDGALKGGRAVASFRSLFSPHRPCPGIQRLSFAGYNKGFEPRRTRNDWLSRDTDVVDAYNRDPLCGFALTADTYREFFGGLLRLNEVERLTSLPAQLPVYLFSGDKCPVGGRGQGVRAVADQYRAAGLQDVTVKLYPDGRHEMLNEINRDEVIADLLGWLDRV